MKRLTLFRSAWTLFLVAATCLPYLLNRAATPPNYHFTWVPPTDPQDLFGYMAWAQQAAHGAWLFKIKYTALPHAPFLFNPFFLVCGWLSAVFSCDIGFIFWCVKAGGTALFLFVLYRYLDFLDLRSLSSTVATILVSIAGGLGGILVFLGVNPQTPRFPADIWMPELTAYWALLRNPLFPFSLTLLLLSIFLLDKATRQKRPTDFWLGGAATGILTLIHPYSLPLLFAFAAIITAARDMAGLVANLGRYLLPVLPFAGYVVALRYYQPLVAEHSSHGAMRSPPLVAYILGFGLPLLLAVAGVVIDRSRIARQYWQIILWFVLSISLAYLPFWFQRKLTFGSQIPVCILAALALESMVNKYSARSVAKYLIIAILVLLLPIAAATPIYFFVRESRDNPVNEQSGCFISRDMMEGLLFLKNRTDPDKVVFASTSTSRFIPAISGNTVVWGHWAMSVDFDQRQKWIANVFNPESGWNDQQRLREFWANDIDFVFVDGESRRWLQTNPFMMKLILGSANKIFENASVSIYQRPPPIAENVAGPEKQKHE